MGSLCFLPFVLLFPECVAKGSRLTLGGLGVEPCSRTVASMFATVRNRSQPSATVRSRTPRRCHWGKLLQVTFHGCVTCQFAPLFHCDLHENERWRKKRDAFCCAGAAFCEICRLLRSSIGISVWRVVFLGCWMWPCHWDLRCRVWHRSSVFVTSLSDFGGWECGQDGSKSFQTCGVVQILLKLLKLT